MTPDRRSVALGLGALAATACTEPLDDKVDGIVRPPEDPSAPAPMKPSRPVVDAASLREFLDTQVAATRVPALAAAIVIPSGVAFMAVSGVQVIGRDEPVTTDDPWHIGSDTKAMTAALYARLVDQGKAEWGATLPDLLPDLAQGMDPGWAGVRIEALLSHTAGLKDVGAAWVVARRFDKTPLMAQRTATARDALSKPPALPVGGYAYSNLGYVIAGAAIERITGQPWEISIRDHVFEPLGMTSAGFGAPQGDAPMGHVRNLFGRLQQVDIDNPPALGPAGTVHLPLSDWANFVRVFIDPEQRFLSRASLGHLAAPVVPEYALGWAIMDVPDAGRVLTHDGSNTAWLAEVVAAPERRIALLVVTNCAHPPAVEAITAVREAVRPILVKGL
jgi:D-alanyl-D-alanine carboxypeptidase